ncbi:chemotaxis response regulator protein-glutamate methylesterase [archaeon]|nr:MAG: chemotaxis response regulator protein-glutamate methylesterase [archaeon]
MSKIRVLIVDDSAVVRVALTRILGSDKDIEVIGAAPDPYVARDMIVKLKPDVITLDVDMPRMDGLTFLKKLMTYYPLPMVMVSSLTQKGCETTIKALELGAVDFVTKPSAISGNLESMAREIISKVKTASKAKVTSLREMLAAPIQEGIYRPEHITTTIANLVLAIGASTGGTEALKVLLSSLAPAPIPGAVVVLHMPENFTKAYAERLNFMFPFDVKEVEDKDRVVPGRVLMAKGNHHMLLSKSGAFYLARIKKGPLVHSCRPSVDVLFKSVAEVAKDKSIGVILTGMGRDGAEGLLAMKKAGAHTIAQDERSCVVFGMPKAAIELGAVDDVLPIDSIGKRILEILATRRVKAVN